MRIDGIAATVTLEREQSLRIERGARVQVDCTAGTVWVTREGDPRDRFLTAGHSVVVGHRGVTLVTALDAATLRLSDVTAPGRDAPPRLKASA